MLRKLRARDEKWDEKWDENGTKNEKWDEKSANKKRSLKLVLQVVRVLFYFYFKQTSFLKERKYRKIRKLGTKA